MAPPTYVFCIGAQKAGTTWLYDYFAAHPSVHVPECKEMHYFPEAYRPGSTDIVEKRIAAAAQIRAQPFGGLRHRLRRAVARRRFPLPGLAELDALIEMGRQPDPAHGRYRAIMERGRGRAPLVADVTPTYDRLDRDAFADMARSFPGSKFIYLMRDPAERAMSHLRMFHRLLAGTPGHPDSFEAFVEALLDGRDYTYATACSDYDAVLRQLEATVPGERMLTLFYETLFRDESIRRLCAFLGIPFRAGAYDRRVNADLRAAPRNPATDRLEEQLRPVYAALQARFGARLPAEWRDPLRPPSRYA